MLRLCVAMTVRRVSKKCVALLMNRMVQPIALHTHTYSHTHAHTQKHIHNHTQSHSHTLTHNPSKHTHTQRDRVTIIHGETGCGKSSRLPIILLEDAEARGEPCRMMVRTCSVHVVLYARVSIRALLYGLLSPPHLSSPLSYLSSTLSSPLSYSSLPSPPSPFLGFPAEKNRSQQSHEASQILCG
jgi:hypothetical protein